MEERKRREWKNPQQTNKQTKQKEMRTHTLRYIFDH